MSGDQNLNQQKQAFILKLQRLIIELEEKKRNDPDSAKGLDDIRKLLEHIRNN